MPNKVLDNLFLGWQRTETGMPLPENGRKILRKFCQELIIKNERMKEKRTNGGNYNEYQNWYIGLW